MPAFWTAALRGFDEFRYRRRIRKALALHLRGEARRDGLRIKGIRTQLDIEWYARDIHPWDRADLEEARSGLFVRHTLADTEAAIGRLFSFLPEIDAITVGVREQNSGNVIMAGTICRSAPMPDTSLSLGMQLRRRGITYYSDGSRFESLGSMHEPYSS